MDDSSIVEEAAEELIMKWRLSARELEMQAQLLSRRGDFTASGAAGSEAIVLRRCADQLQNRIQELIVVSVMEDDPTTEKEIEAADWVIIGKDDQEGVAELAESYVYMGSGIWLRMGLSVEEQTVAYEEALKHRRRGG